MRSSSSSGACLSPTQKSKLGSNLLLQQRKQNKPRKVKSETLQAKHITHEVIKIQCNEGRTDDCYEEGDARGHPQAQTPESLEYLLVVHMGIPKLERLTLLNLLSSPSIAHLKTPIIHNSLQADQRGQYPLKYFFSTTNKDFQEELLFLLPEQKILQRKNGAEAKKNRTTERK